MDLTHVSLFTGIGGLDIAAEKAGFKTIVQCEFADFPYKVLEKNYPDIERWRDIHDLSAESIFRRTGRKEITVISGGFPCQPHSIAGKRKASNDERDLWPEMRRVISEIKPGWVVGENVRGLLSSENGQFFRGILRDFTILGYDVGWCTYRAADVGAIHPRERIAIIAHLSSKRRLEQKIKINTTERDEAQFKIITGNKRKFNTNINNISQVWMRKRSIQRIQEQQEQQSCREIENWTRQSNLFEPKLLRSYHGVPDAMDRIKALGNAVVPEQFQMIFNYIYEIESEKYR